jgi:hypothetical protein
MSEKNYYIPDENQNPVALSFEEYISMLKNDELEDTNYVIQQDVLENGKFVSTVLLMMDHTGGMYETMVFSDSKSYSDIYCDRYSSLADAKAGHQKALEWAKNN